MAPVAKKRAVISYENMPKDLAEAFAEKYPKGLTDYLPDLNKYDKPDGTCFYAVPIEIPCVGNGIAGDAFVNNKLRLQ